MADMIQERIGDIAGGARNLGGDIFDAIFDGLEIDLGGGAASGAANLAKGAAEGIELAEIGGAALEGAGWSEVLLGGGEAALESAGLAEALLGGGELAAGAAVGTGMLPVLAAGAAAAAVVYGAKKVYDAVSGSGTTQTAQAIMSSEPDPDTEISRDAVAVSDDFPINRDPFGGK